MSGDPVETLARPQHLYMPKESRTKAACRLAMTKGRLERI